MRTVRTNALSLAAAALSLVACLAGCGIDEYIYLEPVSNVTNNPTDTPDASFRYYAFITKDADNAANASGYFKGWEIYYRIYNSQSDRNTDTAAIAAKIDADPANAFYYVSTTKKYRRMTFIHGNDTSAPYSAPLLTGDTVDRTVLIRPYTINETYPAAFTVNGVPWTISGENVLVWRSVSEVLAKSFEHADISSTDADVQFNSGSSTGSWYAQAYAFAYGFDTSFKVIYSKPVSLGSITIEP